MPNERFPMTYIVDEPTGNTYLNLSMQNFGPISYGEVSLKPLTVFVGPNSSGKSHAATLIHSIITAESESRELAASDTMTVAGNNVLLRNESMRIHHEHTINGQDTVKSLIYDKIVGYTVQFLREIIIHNFSVPVEKLIRVGGKRFLLNIETQNTSAEFVNTNYESYGSTGELEVKFVDTKPLQKTFTIKEDDTPPCIIIPHSPDVDTIYNALKTKLQYGRITRSIYFPAERGGLTLAHKPIISNYYDRLGKFTGKLSDPNISGTAASFLRWLIDIPKNDGPFAHIVQQFEEQALKGEVTMKQDVAKMPEMYFRQAHIDIPLHTASSSIKDLAVLLLCVKHVMKPRDLLILEEPEVNLHPNNQILMARLIARLVNAGLYVLVSTHSEFFLEQLSHCILAHTANNKPKNVLPASEILQVDSVAAYRFVSDEDGYNIQSILTENGILQTEFMDVFDKQYDELLNIRAQPT